MEERGWSLEEASPAPFHHHSTVRGKGFNSDPFLRLIQHTARGTDLEFRRPT